MKVFTEKQKASVTVFLSLVMLTLLGVTSALMEVVKVHNMKSHVRLSNESAINSTFAEYSVLLRDKFGLFGLDGTYLGATYSEENILRRYDYYGGDADDVEIEALQFMTDASFAGVKEQMIYYMQSQYGLNIAEDLLGKVDKWEELELDGGQVSEGLEDLTDLKGQIEESTQEGASDLMEGFEGFDIDLIFRLVTQGMDVSSVKIDMTQLPSKRELIKGYGTIAIRDYSGTTEKLLVTEYIKKVFPRCQYSKESSGLVNEGNMLQYQMEYILEGKSSDKENLKAVIHKLILMRVPINYGCLMTDPVKQGEAHALAVTLSLASSGIVPEPIIYQALLWAWSYAESATEVKSLLEGKNVALVKTSKEWQFDLSGLLSFGKDGIAGADQSGGLSYAEYLRMLLYLEKGDVVVSRAADMMEHTIREKYEEKNFSLDACVYSLHLQVDKDIGRGLSYKFPVRYGYR